MNEYENRGGASRYKDGSGHGDDGRGGQDPGEAELNDQAMFDDEMEDQF